MRSRNRSVLFKLSGRLRRVGIMGLRRVIDRILLGCSRFLNRSARSSKYSIPPMVYIFILLNFSIIDHHQPKPYKKVYNKSAY